MTTKRIATILLAAALAIVTGACGGDSSSDPTGPASLSGNWSGSTSHGKTIGFTVSGTSITYLKFGFRVQGNCSLNGTLEGTISIPINGNSFSKTFSSGSEDYTISGSFSSDIAASGSLTTASPCGTSTASWTAAR